VLAVVSDIATAGELAAADLFRLTQILQPPSRAALAVPIEKLIRESVSAIHEGRIEWAVGSLINAASTGIPRGGGEIGAKSQIVPAALSAPLIAKAPAPPVIADIANVRELAAADLLKLTQILQPAGAPERTARVDALIRETVISIHEGKIEWAVGRLIEAATIDPARVDEIRSKPEFETIRANVEHVVAHMTNVAKMYAETKLASAEQLLEEAGYPKLPHWETTPETLIHIGHRLIEAGGYANYVHTAELASTLQSAYWAAAVAQPDGAVGPGKEEALKSNGRPTTRNTYQKLREQLPGRVRALWMRAPLLVLFGIWFVLGLAGGLLSRVAKVVWPDSWIVSSSDFAFQIWGLGMLALVGFGFWARVRKPRV
jgi:hypothetical protein